MRMICKKHGLFKFIAILIVVTGILFGSSIDAKAGSYSQKYRTCPSCKHTMSSYGYNPDMTWTTVSVNGGNYCDPCGINIPSDEYHMYLYSSDLYFFRCGNCGGMYSYPYNNPVSEHYTNGVRDY